MTDLADIHLMSLLQKPFLGLNTQFRLEEFSSSLNLKTPRLSVNGHLQLLFFSCKHIQMTRQKP